MPSGIGWMSTMPSDWERKRLKTLFREVDRRSTTGTEKLLSLRMRRGLIGHVDAGGKPIDPEALVGFKRVAPGQVVMNRMRAASGLFAITPEAGLVSPDYAVFDVLSGVNARFYVELFKTPMMAAVFRAESKGLGTGDAGFLRLYTDRFGTIGVPFPPPDQQAAIVRFLDHANRRMQRFIRAKQMLIKLLEEQKQAIILRAITRGLDPNVRMKPSGVEWLGEVPKHWEVKRLKWVTRLQRGYDLPAERRVAGPYPVVSSGGVIDTHREAKCSGPGVVMGRYGSTDAVFYIEQDFWPHNTSLFVTDFQGNSPEWCFYLLRSITKADHAGKSAVPGVDRKDLFQILVPRPELAEQEQTISAIHAANTEVSDAVRVAEREVELLREYRSRLIADVVTGKLDVRKAAAPLPDEPVDSELAASDSLGDEEDVEPSDLDTASEEADE